MLQNKGVFLLFSLAMISSALLGIFLFYEPMQEAPSQAAKTQNSSAPQ